ncbi:MAG TPA: hypothetical protein VIC25_05155, partial [Caulobacteraceae bacterium]
MKRTILAAAVAVAPLLAVSAPAVAQVTISGSQSTPVTTATANNGQPANVIVSGNISVTAPGTDLTLDSNNTVSVTGTLGAQNQNNTVGLDIVGGFTGSASNSGAININESYTPPADPNHNGLNTGAFAQGSNRVGILVSLPSAGSPVFVGGITNTGAITVQGNNSEGVSIQAPISGDFLSLVVTPATTPTGSPTIANGSISVTGQNAIGLQITPTGGVGGNMRIVNVSATGPGAQALELNGAVGGFLNISGAVVATGYRTTSRQTNPFLAVNYSQMEMQQGGAAVTLGGNVGAGFIVSATPPILSTTNLDLDADGVPDTLQGNGAVVSFGASPAIQVGAASGANITVGAFTASHYISPYNANTFGVPAQFGMVIQGQVLAQGLFDQLTSPNLLAPVSATAIQIGGPILITPPLFSFDSNNQPTSTTPAPAVYGASGQVNIVGGLYNSGTISAASFQADATGIHLGAGANVPTIYNDGAIFASSTQVNSATTVTVNGKGIPNTPAPVAVNVVAIQIDAGANIPTITNNSG